MRQDALLTINCLKRVGRYYCNRENDGPDLQAPPSHKGTPALSQGGEPEMAALSVLVLLGLGVGQWSASGCWVCWNTCSQSCPALSHGVGFPPPLPHLLLNA